MKNYLGAFGLFLIMSCNQVVDTDQSKLAEARNFNNQRSYSKTINLLGNESSLTISQQEELIYAYTGSAGIEAVTMKQDMEQVEQIISNEEISLTKKIKEILKVIPSMNQDKLANLNSAIKLYESLQTSGHLQDKDSKFKLGILYFYRALHTTALMLEFADEGIAQDLEGKLNQKEVTNIADFFNKNMANAFSDIKRSYDQLVNSYAKIKKIADKVDETLKFFLSDESFKVVLEKDFNKITDIYNLYFKKVNFSFENYVDDLESIAQALGLEKSVEDIFVEFRENPERAERVFARIEVTLELFFKLIESENKEELEYFNNIFPEDLKEEFKVKVAESWRLKSTQPINDWLNNNSSSVGKLKQFAQKILDTANERGLDEYLDNEVLALTEMIDQEAVERLNEKLEIFNTLAERPSEDLETDLNEHSKDLDEQLEEANGKLQNTIELKTKEYEETIGSDRIEFTDDEIKRAETNIDQVKDIIGN